MKPRHRVVMTRKQRPLTHVVRDRRAETRLDLRPETLLPGLGATSGEPTQLCRRENLLFEGQRRRLSVGKACAAGTTSGLASPTGPQQCREQQQAGKQQATHPRRH